MSEEKNTAEVTIEKIQDAIENIADKADDIKDVVGDKIDDIKDVLEDKIDDLKDALGDKGGDLKDAIVEKAAAVKDKVQETMADFEDKLDKDKFDAPVWDKFKSMMDNKEVITVKIENAVKGGVVTAIDGIRAFIPQSHLSLQRIEDLTTMVGKEVKVNVIEAEQSAKKLVLSAREVLRQEARQAKRDQAANIPVGTVLSGKVETLQPYGAFIRLENGLSGLVHVSQISQKRVKTPEDVLKIGDEVQVKVINVKDGKLSLSMKALQAPAEEEKAERPARPRRERPEREEKIEIPKAENISTNLGSLLKDIKLD